MTQVIGFVDRRWKPPRKSKLELQIDREDTLYWARKEAKPVTYVHRPHQFKLSAVAKYVFARSIEYAHICNPLNV